MLMFATIGVVFSVGFHSPSEIFPGTFQPGDDLLYIIVAGDIRENIKPVLAELLDRIKAEAVTKKEIFSV